MNQSRAIPTSLLLAVAIAALVLGTAALTATAVGRSPSVGLGVGGFGMMGGRPPMMGGAYGGTWVGSDLGPGADGFVAGTAASPRVVRVFAGPGYTFTPSAIPVQRGETITFVVTTMGPLVHEFMVGPADAVAADREGTPEIADIGMMQTKSLTYTFDGPGPFAFACHAEGHYEAGMRGTIALVG